MKTRRRLKGDVFYVWSLRYLGQERIFNYLVHDREQMFVIDNTRNNTVEIVIESRILLTLYIIADVVSLDLCRMVQAGRLNVIQTLNIFAALSTVSVVAQKSIAFVTLATTIVPYP